MAKGRYGKYGGGARAPKDRDPDITKDVVGVQELEYPYILFLHLNRTAVSYEHVDWDPHSFKRNVDALQILLRPYYGKDLKEHFDNMPKDTNTAAMISNSLAKWGTLMDIMQEVLPPEKIRARFSK